ncbi:LOW QUALITY PROTEIN: leucine-rich repeat-containing protein 2 [Xenentodon cancila]
MSPERKVDVPVYDLSLIRGLWEVRARKYRQRQKKEKERIDKSALAKIDQEWQYRIYCKTMKTTELNLLHHYLERSTLSHTQRCTGDQQQNQTFVLDQKVQQDQKEPHQEKLIFQLDGDHWMDFPKELQWMTYLQEWYIRGTRIRQLPDYLALFTHLIVLEIPKNSISELPPEIGKRDQCSIKHAALPSNRRRFDQLLASSFSVISTASYLCQLTELRRLNAGYNHLFRVPPELGDCQNLERLELEGNNLTNLPFELNRLKQLVHLDISENKLKSIPICALRMTSLQVLDLSNNDLNDLPQDMDRLEHLVSLFIHKNNLTYLPHCLTNISTLKMVVVSGDELTCIPTKLCSNPNIKFIRLYDNPASEEKRKKKREEEKKKKEEEKRRRWREQKEVVKDSREKEFLEAYISSLKDRDIAPSSTTKVSISCLL